MKKRTDFIHSSIGNVKPHRLRNRYHQLQRELR